MKCRECAEGKQYAEGSVWCIKYGIIIREDHECTREGGRLREDGDGDQGSEVQGKTEDKSGDGERAA